MRIAVVGCSHGELDNIYASAEHADHEARQRGEPGIDLLICCGDFQAMRSPPDLHAMACPPKFRRLGHFHHYYAGRKRAPFLTLVVGGNHESSGFMWECYHGGWLAPDIYFLGFAGCVIIDGWLRIAGASGIYKSHDFSKGHFETVPYDDRTIRSVYHIRQYDVARLLQLKNRGPPIDIFISHDWPLGIEQYGDTQNLLKAKPFFRDEVNSNTLGSPPLLALMRALQPAHWFAAHLHVKFAALYKHDGSATTVSGRRPPRHEEARPPTSAVPVEVRVNPDEIALDDDDDDDEGDQGANEMESEEKGCASGCGGDHDGVGAPANPEEIAMSEEEEGGAEPANADGDTTSATLASAPVASPSVSSARTTKLLALSKPGFGKDFMQIIDIPAPSSANSQPAAVASKSTPRRASPPSMAFDPHWLAVVRTLAPQLSLTHQSKAFPPPSELDAQIDANLEWVKKNVGENGDGMVDVREVMTFVKTAPDTDLMNHDGPPTWYTNPQTEAFAALLDIPNAINPIPAHVRAQVEADKLAAVERAKSELAEAKKAALREMELETAEEDGKMEGVDEEPRGEKAGEVV